MTLVWRPGFAYDTDASAYIDAVEAADEIASPGIGALETATRYAINDFVLGCKQDGIWSAIKASCILSGARTLAGALIPLAGTAPTNANFVSGDYNRKTGLVGNGSTKYLDSNRSALTDPIDNRHFSTFNSSITANNTITIGYYKSSTPVFAYMIAGTSGWRWSCNTVNQTSIIGPTSVQAKFAGVNKVTSGTVSARFGQANYSASLANSALIDLNAFVFARNNDGTADIYSNARLAFYSIGESLDLARLDARVTDLINAFAVAIP